jgi:two-component system cell cycle sensor histidine kinase/response regulator CckA
MSDPESSSPPEPDRPGQRGVVLLADDEDAVRSVGRRLLEADGWTVLEATDGLEALQIIQTLTSRLDLVITDLNMPRVSGRELAEVLSIFRPGLPVLGVSGFLNDVFQDRRLPILP